MTATATRPRSAPPTGPPARGAPTSPAARSSSQLLALAELALVGVTLAATLGLARLFVDGSFLLPVLGSAFAASTLAIACRRRGLGPATTAVIATFGLNLVVIELLLPETTSYGVPTGRTLDQAGAELSAAWETFRTVVAPAPVEPGFILASVAAVWLLVFVADTAAFRAGALVEAVVPGATLFVFGAALGAPRHRVVTTGLFLAAVAAYWLTQRALRSTSSPTWLAGARAGSVTLLRAGVGLGALAVVAGVVLGPVLPGADARALLPWRARDRDGPGTRVTVSPLVDIRSRIVDQADVEVFAVRSDARSYWRLTSLERFDGRIWSSRASYREVDGALASDVPPAPAAVVSTQEFEVGALSSIWLPVAYRPIDLESSAARFDPESASLLAEEATSDGLRYRVESEVLTADADTLRAASLVPVPPEVAEQYLSLPPDFDPRVVAEAQRVVAAAETPFDRAKALQDHFRGGLFTYDTEIGRGHGTDDLFRFLFETKRGYCEQFAGSYGAMARAIGLPARVAVGFTPGEIEGDGRYHVRGLNGHAWPEVWLGDAGWVAFEPTPGRGIPGAQAYTGLAEEQASPTGPSTTLATTTTTAVPGGPGSTAPLPLDLNPGLSLGGGSGITEVDPPSPWPRRALVALAVVVAVPALWAVLVSAAAALRRWRRRSRASTPAARVLVAWEEASDSLARAGAPRRSAETPREYARRASAATGVDAALLADLANQLGVAAYAPGDLPGEGVDAATTTAGAVERQANATLRVRARLRALLDPRPLLADRRSRVSVRDTASPPGG